MGGKQLKRRYYFFTHTRSKYRTGGFKHPVYIQILTRKPRIRVQLNCKIDGWEIFFVFDTFVDLEQCSFEVRWEKGL